MSDACCVIPAPVETRARCPVNGKVGQKVDTQTVKALLRLPLNVLRSAEYRFCPDPDCPAVYYSADGTQTFTEADLRERVFQKHPEDAEVFVCYCFQHTVGEVRTRGAAVIDEITQGVKAGQCACDIRNPQGSCCLGNVRSLLSNSKSKIFGGLA